MDTKRIVQARNNGLLFQTEISNGKHNWQADEPADLEGTDLAPSPGEHLCAALASCVAITLRMYVNRKGWDIPHIQVEVTYDTDPNDENATVFTKNISIGGDVDEKQKKRILQIASKCPIEKILTGNVTIGSEVV